MSEQGEHRPSKEGMLLRAIFGNVELSLEEEAAKRRARIIRVLGLPKDTTLTSEELADLVKQRYEEIGQKTAQEMLVDHINKVFAPLNPREKLVLDLRYGFKDGRERTLEEIGKSIGRSRTTAWRVEHQALAKLRELNPPPDMQLPS